MLSHLNAALTLSRAIGEEAIPGMEIHGARPTVSGAVRGWKTQDLMKFRAGGITILAVVALRGMIPGAAGEVPLRETMRCLQQTRHRQDTSTVNFLTGILRRPRIIRECLISMTRL